MVYLKDAPFGLVCVVFILGQEGDRGRGAPTSAYLVAFGVEDSKLWKEKLRPKNQPTTQTKSPVSCHPASR